MKDSTGPALKLIITKGPNSGFESSFSPTVKINIGRVARGNKVSIKDAGISSKHLVLNFDSGSDHWTITDLESSNGTILNSILLDPLKPYNLYDNDVIKFGEETAIKVKIEEFSKKRGGEDDGNVGRKLRVTRRRGEFGRIEESSELGFCELGENETKRGRGRGRGGRGQKSGSTEVGEVVERLENVGGNEKVFENETKRGRGRGRGRGPGPGGGQESEDSEIGRDCERLENLGGNEVKDEGERLENLGENEVKDEGVVSVGIKRVTRSWRKIGNEGSMNDVRMVSVDTGRVTRGRIMRSRRNVDVVEYGVHNSTIGEEIMGAVEKKGKGRGRSRKSTMGSSIEKCGLGERTGEESEENRVKLVQEEDCGNGLASEELKVLESFENGQIREEMGDKSDMQEGDCGEVEKNLEGGGVETRNEVCGDGLASSSRSNYSVLSRLETITLGQWFDYIEEYLPKHIVEQSEEMIMEMRHKAERFHEFMLQHKAANGGGRPIVI